MRMEAGSISVESTFRAGPEKGCLKMDRKMSTEEGCLKLVVLIALEVDRDGGIAVSSRISSYNSEIRKLLSDRRLVPFLREWPQVFELSHADGDYRVRTLQDWKSAVSGLSAAQPRDTTQQSPVPVGCRCTCCGIGFCSRSALFRHLAGGLCPTAATDDDAATTADADSSAQMQSADTAEGKALLQALIFALRRRLLRMGRRGEQQQSDCNPPEVQQEARVSWLAQNKKAKVQLTLIKYVRSLPASETGRSDGSSTRTPGLVLLSNQWWSEAEQLLTAFLHQKTHLFETVLEKQHSPEAEPVVTVRLLESAAAEAECEAQLVQDPVCTRVLSLLKNQRSTQSKSGRLVEGGSGRHYLGRLAADVSDSTAINTLDICWQAGIQKLLAGREFNQVLRACPQIDGPHEHNRQGCWYVRLVSNKQLSKRRPESVSPNGHSHTGEPTTSTISSCECRRPVTPRAARCRHVQELCRDLGRPTPVRLLWPTPRDRLAASTHGGVCKTVEIVSVSAGMAVVNKPAGISTEELVAGISEQMAVAMNCEPGYAIQTVSRLDQPTSGALILPTSAAAELFLIDNFKKHVVQKTYLCVCRGETPAEGTIEARLKVIDNRRDYRAVVHHQGLPAVTKYRRLKLLKYRDAGVYSLLEVSPISGRTHQIRAHMLSIGHALLGDAKYNPKRRAALQAAWCPRLFLHAHRLQLCDLHGEPVDVSVALPTELQSVLDSMHHVIMNDD